MAPTKKLQEEPRVADTSELSANPAGLALPPPVRDHLGRELRAAYHALAEKPAFLGEAVAPPELDDQVRALETRARAIHDRGVEAVETALKELAEGDAAPQSDGDERRPASEG
jgi:hypothetical protein